MTNRTSAAAERVLFPPSHLEGYVESSVMYNTTRDNSSLLLLLKIEKGMTMWHIYNVFFGQEAEFGALLKSIKGFARRDTTH